MQLVYFGFVGIFEAMEAVLNPGGCASVNECRLKNPPKLSVG
jgi:hypothetical protein